MSRSAPAGAGRIAQGGGQMERPASGSWGHPSAQHFFDFDQDVLRPESNTELQQIAQLARNNQYIIKLTGYTDNDGNTDFNLVLSRRRAEAARKALMALGVAPDQVVAEGRGESGPVVANDTEEHRAKNRRVVIQLLQR
ncbi:MAG: OmpA family protein [Saprospirales bacterium]|nr:OmpA family protein [Saprospirales bacterium]